jgi:hypothetical protein
VVCRNCGASSERSDAFFAFAARIAEEAADSKKKMECLFGDANTETLTRRLRAALSVYRSAPVPA